MMEKMAGIWQKEGVLHLRWAIVRFKIAPNQLSVPLAPRTRKALVSNTQRD
jgi:hypothetical protein